MTLYQPRHFVVEDREQVLAVMHAHPLATLVSVSDAAPSFTHLPLVADAGPAGVRLRGHVAHANPHWSHWQAGGVVTAIFSGPDGYVSPRWYTTREAVPTWNYVVVHAHGRVTVSHDSAEKETILKALIAQHDPAYRAQWDELGEEFRERQKRAIVGVTIEVERLEGKFKLSQNRPRVDQARVLGNLAAGDADARALADWMQRLGIGADA